MAGLTQKFCSQNDIPDGVYRDSKIAGLYMRVRNNSKHCSWYLKRMVNRKSYTVSIGPLKRIDLAHARAIATQLNAMTGAEFVCFIVESKAAKKAVKNDVKPKEQLTFRQVVDSFIAWNIEVGNWQEYGKAHKVFVGRMNNHILPTLGDLPFAEITEEDVSRAMIPIWQKPETVNRCLRITKNVFDWGKAKGLRAKDNPADRHGALKYLLPQTRWTPRNRGALSVKQLPSFMADLYRHLQDGASWQCAFFAVLTATRSKTAREARWEQIDWNNREWVIPPSQLKVSDNGSLIVPLASEVLEFLKSIKGEKCEGLIFPNHEGKVMSDTMFSSVVKRLEKHCDVKFTDDAQELRTGKSVRATMHGIARATFRTWAQDDALGNDKRFDARTAELCLHHKVNDNYNGAYERNESRIRRREMMEAWARFCFSRIVRQASG